METWKRPAAAAVFCWPASLNVEDLTEGLRYEKVILAPDADVTACASAF
jgi:hypothetical protein